jgi:hypothetical protein
MRHVPLILVTVLSVAGLSQSTQPDWSKIEPETLQHFQALVQFDTSDPPGREVEAVEYLKKVLEAEGIPTQTFALEAHRPNLVARLKGSGRKRPLLLMGHTDVVNVDPKKWTFPPFSATRDGGYIYGRGTVDDKDNLVSSLMVMLTLKRLKVPLDRDVIFLAESGEEGSTRVGIQFMVNEQFPQIDAEYCLAEGGGVSRSAGAATYASIQTLEKLPYAVQLTARGVAGHGSVPSRIWRRRSRPSRTGGPKSGSTRPRARTSAGSPKSRRPREPRDIGPSSIPRKSKRSTSTFWSRSPGTRRCCARRCRQTSSTPATAST